MGYTENFAYSDLLDYWYTTLTMIRNLFFQSNGQVVTQITVFQFRLNVLDPV